MANFFQRVLLSAIVGFLVGGGLYLQFEEVGVPAARTGCNSETQAEVALLTVLFINNLQYDFG